MSNNSKVLALKYRPQIFDDLIGQEVVAETITNSIKADKIPNAYLFTGIRGVGKTTVARIVAKSLNCLNGKENLCRENFCENCIAISESRHIDVLEMDAASKTGVDDVRDLIEFSRYGPTSAKYKIFIIDEVHMLSKQAFNALLKTLEEPPKYLKFIFATTEVNKLPVTVLSRCQRFDLMRIKFEDMFNFLKNVTLKEKESLNEDIIKLIVKISEGSVRDALSLLDRIFLSNNPNGKKLDLKAAQEIFGYFDKSYLLDLISELLKGNEEKVIKLYKNIYNQGIEPKLFINNFLEIIYYLKNFKNLNNFGKSIDFSDVDYKKIEELSKQVDDRTLLLFWEFSVETINEINLVSNQNLAIEMFLIRLLYLKRKASVDTENLTNSSDTINIQNNLNNENSSKKIESSKNNNTIINQIKFSSQEKEKASIEDDELSNKTKINSFSELISICNKKREIGLKYELEKNVNLVSFKNNNIEISFNENLDKNFIKNLTSKLFDWTGERWIILLSKKTGLKSIKEIEKENNENEFKNLKNSDIYEKATNLFPDLEIVDINYLKNKDNE